MPDVFDYLEWRGDLSLSEVPFNDVDSLILCLLSYVPFDGILGGDFETEPMTVRDAEEKLCRVLNDGEMAKELHIISQNDIRLLAAMAESERFGFMKLAGYVNKIDLKEQEQFSAVTVLFPDGSAYIAFRGTDDTLVGWKEDFNMSFLLPVPAQVEAVRYLEEAAKAVEGPISLGGHSKGGNLAVYAAAFGREEIRSRIRAVYNNDGPGFEASVIRGEGYQAVRERIRTFVPQTSVIGMLLDHEEEYTVIHSVQSGLLQHDPYSWEVERRGFICLDTVTDQSRFIDMTLKQWIAGMTKEQREGFVDGLFEIFSVTQAKTVPELTSGWAKNARVILKTLKTVDEPTRQLISGVITSLFKAARKNLKDFRPRPDKKTRKKRGG